MLQGLIPVIIIVAIVVKAAVYVLKEYERGVVFFLGRLAGVRGPGLVFIIPFVERLIKVDQRTVTMDIPPQDVITKDNVSRRVEPTGPRGQRRGEQAESSSEFGTKGGEAI